MKRVAVGFLTATVMALLFIRPLLPDRVTLQIGQEAPHDIVAHRYVRYLDERETDRLRALAEGAVEPIYARVGDAASQVDRDLNGFFDRLRALRQERRAPASEEIIAEARRAAPPRTADRSLRIFITADPSSLESARRAALTIAGEGMRSPLRSDTDDVQLRADQVPARLAESGLGPPLQEALADLVGRSLRPNRILDRSATEEARGRERQTVQPVYREVNRGEVIVRKGERITRDHMDKFVELGLQRPKVDPIRALSLTLLAFGLVAVFALYLFQFHARTYGDLRAILLIAVVATGTLLLFRLGSGALDLRLSGEQSGYVGMMTAALAAMLIAGLLSAQIALFVGIWMSVVIALLAEDQLRFAIIAMSSSIVGATMVANIKDRAGILRAAVAVAIANVMAIFITLGATSPLTLSEASTGLAWGIIGALISVFLFVPAGFILERPFRLTTHLTLLELSDPNHPLLKRLSMEAPGTYAHSIIVGNLSEAAAKAIGADSLFSRVASYYHDIGKVVRPQFFVENQSIENRHTGMSASLSCLVVTAHVKDGVELAEKHRLPPPIIDIIKEHHGTCLIKYFYHRAVTGSEDATPALEYQFRYEGPRPQTKESGIIMLADAAEAASRTLEKPTPARIRDLVETIVRDRLQDAQLDECELTFKDLEKIIASITRSLSSLLHARVEYPSVDTRELTRLATDASAHKELVATGKALTDIPAPGGSAYRESAEG